MERSTLQQIESHQAQARGLDEHLEQIVKLADKLRPGPYRIGPRAADREIVTNRQFRPGATLAAHPYRKSRTVCCWSSRRDAELVVVDLNLPGGRRQMEWQEAAALQGFPSDYVFHGSPGDVWKMLGQAVQIDTARAILGAIIQHAEPQTAAVEKGLACKATAS